LGDRTPVVFVESIRIQTHIEEAHNHVVMALRRRQVEGRVAAVRHFVDAGTYPSQVPGLGYRV
jgi:hypothetical protein